MDEITFSDSYEAISGSDVGVRRKHAIEAIQSADKVQSIVPDDDNHLVFIKRISIASPPYLLAIFTLRKDNNLFVQNAFKVYPTLVSNIEDKNPLELLEHFANQFGLKIRIAGSEYKKFFIKERILIGSFSLEPNKLITVDNPENHNFITVSTLKIETGIERTINCALCFCIDINLYSRWVRSKGEYSFYNEETSRLQRFATEKVLPNASGKEFREKVLIAIHDFCFYCRQHPESLSRLYEEQIRDLFLIVIKTIFSSAEGEPFHYNGKLDFKITNPKNKYEMITGEFKWWRGYDSAHEILHQSIRKHATGQELDIYTVILNKNKDSGSVFEAVKRIFYEQPEIIPNSFLSKAPEGSKEMFGCFTAKVRDKEIPLYLALGDLFFERV